MYRKQLEAHERQRGYTESEVMTLDDENVIWESSAKRTNEKITWNASFSQAQSYFEASVSGRLLQQDKRHHQTGWFELAGNLIHFP